MSGIIISSYRGAQTGGVSSPEPHTETLLELGLEPGFPPPSLFPLPLGCRELSVAFGCLYGLLVPR